MVSLSGASARTSRDNSLIRALKREYPRGLSRTCGLPGCGKRMAVDLLAEESDFKAKAYCTADHQDAANRRRKKLRATLVQIERLLDSPDSLAELNREARGATRPTKTLTRAELKSIARRLQWELEGMPPARVGGASRQ